MATLSLSVPSWWPRCFGVAWRPWSVLLAPARWRRAVTWGLGLLWLLDAALQFQPYMFTRAFPDQVIRPAGTGSPAWVAAPVRWAAGLLAAHVVVFNTLFATTQLLIALGLFLTATLRLALAASVVWAVLVWWLGEGLGGTLAGPVSPLMGLPGAVILYALIALLVWPARRPPGPRPNGSPPERGSIAAGGLLGAPCAHAVWVLLWTSLAIEAVRPANRAPSALHDMIAGMAGGEPHWLAAIDTRAADAVAHNGTGYSIALAALCAGIAVSVLVPALTRVGLALAIVLALAIWIVGEDLGQIATGTGTDPNTGLPLALLAVCYWPRSWTTTARTTAARTTAARTAGLPRNDTDMSPAARVDSPA